MSEFTFDPPISNKSATALIQTITMHADGRQIGWVRWHGANARTGVAQILEIRIEEKYRRKGHGSRLMAALVEQCCDWHRAHGSKLRRIWGLLRQKEQVIGRAFFTHTGFTHIATVRDLLPAEDALVYFRSFD